MWAPVPVSAAVASTRRQVRESGRGAVRSAGRSEYRHDLDGLRAVAILLVAVYHVFLGRVSGGVDVFLMLSGFFVGGGLLRGFVSGQPVRLFAYLRKLARRLVPALALVLATVAGAGALWFPQTQWKQIAEELFASITYRQNWFLAFAGQEYGAADAAQSPLQHIWSMSVQGQIFVGLPLVLLVVWWLTAWISRRARYLAVVVVVVVLCAASLVYAVHGVSASQPFAYYDTGARLWEYLAGTLLAVVGTKIRLSRVVASVAGLVGLGTILMTGVLLNAGATFPGLAALVPLAGAALVIVSRQGVVSQVLAWGPIAKAGRYAYTFYLWHWPVLIFAIGALGSKPDLVAGVGILCVSAVLAAMTHHGLENPLRGPGRAPVGRSVLVWLVVAAMTAAPFAWSWHVAQRAAAATGVASSVPPAVDTEEAPVPPEPGQEETSTGQEQGRATALVPLDSLSGTYPGALTIADPTHFPFIEGTAAIPDLLSVKADKTQSYKEGCFARTKDSTAVTCEYGDRSAERVLAVVGGSHIQQWADALDVLGQQHQFRVRLYIKHACEFFATTDGVPGSMWTDACIDWNANVMNELLKDGQRPDAVFTTATRGSDDKYGERVPGGFAVAIERLDAAGITTIGWRDLGFLPEDPVDALAGPSAKHSLPQDSLYAPSLPTQPLEERLQHLTIVDLTDILCPNGQCPLVQGGRVVYLDTHHLTPTWATSAGPILWERIQPALSW